MHNLSSLISNSKENKNYMESLIKSFSPLIKKYSYKLNYDGAETDLIIKFIETIHSISNNKIILSNPKLILSYINKSIKNHYIYLAKNNSKLQINKSMELLDNHYENFLFVSNDLNFNNIDLKSILTTLNNKELYVIVNILKGYSVSEISKNLSISRQAVNKIKLKAFSKIKEYLRLESY
ncbi:MAG: sigma-70 family RNA polymerase sigma factor [Clostridium sp.]